MVGKNLLLTRFIKGKYVKTDLNLTLNTNVFYKSLEIKGKIFDLTICDTAGEEKYHALAPVFYRGAQGAVIIFDVTKRDNFNRTIKWFNELNEFAEKDIKIILVGNNIDLPNREVTNEEAIEVARKYNCNFLEASARLGTNVDEIFISLTNSIYLQQIDKHKKNKHFLEKKELQINKFQNKKEPYFETLNKYLNF